MNYHIIFISTILISLFGCRKTDVDIILNDADYADWTETTHGGNVAPDYSIVFNQNEVLRFDIEISDENWQSMQDDLDDNLSSGGPGGPGGPGSTSDFDPIWVPCTFMFDSTEWYNVGIRFKGNSSLQSSYQSGNNKLSFKLDFDEYEDHMGDYQNQRFYGFRQLNLNNNFDDPSLMREKVGADLFRQFGLVASHTSFCVLYIDFGNGPQYFGVYALVEEVDDTVLEDQFSIGTGNLYKPDGDAATFSSGTYDVSEMELKTNTDAANYSDVQALYDIVNSTDRISDPQQWKSELESVFNVDVFLKWLAANTVIQNWDTYGIMSHNYYLYNNPSDDKLTWIPWDNNEAFQEGKLGGALSLSLSEVGNDWPLISYLIDIDEYNTTYEDYLQQFIDNVFIPADLITSYEKYYLMLKDYAYDEQTGYTYITYDAKFDQEVSTLKTHVQSRNDAVDAFL